MWKWLTVSIKTIKEVVKYAGLATVIIGIMGYAAAELEKWKESNEPKEK
jgi:hypothetical protein